MAAPQSSANAEPEASQAEQVLCTVHRGIGKEADLHRVLLLVRFKLLLVFVLWLYPGPQTAASVGQPAGQPCRS